MYGSRELPYEEEIKYYNEDRPLLRQHREVLDDSKKATKLGFRLINNLESEDESLKGEVVWNQRLAEVNAFKKGR